MSRENLATLRELWHALMAGDLDDLSGVDAEVLYEDDALPDHVGEKYVGHDGIRRAWARFTEPWDRFENEIEWVRDAGDEVVSFHRVRVRGEGSGIEGEFTYAYLWRFRAGKVVYMKSYGEAAEALEAVGLRE
jgi:ketosteroid isomerase-like protein